MRTPYFYQRQVNGRKAVMNAAIIGRATELVVVPLHYACTSSRTMFTLPSTMSNVLKVTAFVLSCVENNPLKHDAINVI